MRRWLATITACCLFSVHCASLPAEPTPEHPLWRCVKGEPVKIIGEYDNDKYKAVFPASRWPWLPVPKEQVKPCKQNTIMPDASQAGYGQPP